METNAPSLSTARYVCRLCNSAFRTQSGLSRHLVLCEYSHADKKKVQTDLDRYTDMNSISHEKLIGVVRELTMKCKVMEHKMQEMGQWISSKRRRFNVLKWLRNEYLPPHTYTDWLKTFWVCTPNEVDRIDMSYLDVLAQKPIAKLFGDYIIEKLNSLEETPFPIACFSHSSQSFYVFCPHESMLDWRKMTFADFSVLIQQVQSIFIAHLLSWNKKYSSEVKRQSYLMEKHTHALSRIASITVTPDAKWSQVRQQIYEHLKIDTVAQYAYLQIEDAESDSMLSGTGTGAGTVAGAGVVQSPVSQRARNTTVVHTPSPPPPSSTIHYSTSPTVLSLSSSRNNKSMGELHNIPF